MQEKIMFESQGARIAGVIHLPKDYRPGQRRPAVIMMHGFGSNMEAANVTTPMSLSTDWGYVGLRFDRRGCGASGGVPGLNHPTAEGWDKFVHMLARGKEHKVKTGTSLLVHRYDIVPIPPHLRGGLPPTAIMEFPHETAQSIYDFRPDDVVANIAPRPALFLHAAPDSVTPTSESLELFCRAKPPAELHLFHGVDHFMLAQGNARVSDTLRGWLGGYLPAA